jgi:hypothetical protein
MNLMNQSLKLLEKFVKKNKEFRIFLDVAQERSTTMQGGAPAASTQQTTQSTAPPATSPPAAAPPSTDAPSTVPQPKMKKKGGPDLSKK